MFDKSSIPESYWNAVLYFEVEGKGFKQDSETGNLTLATDTVVCKAILKQESRGRSLSQPGQNVSEISVVGYMASPTKMPVQPPVEVEAEIDGKRGRLKIPLSVRTPYAGDLQEKYAGQKIQGTFRVQG